MAQIAAEEFKGWECFGFGAVGIGSILPAEGDGIVRDGEKARIGDGRASDVSAEIFEGGSSRTSRLDMHAPVFAPDCGGRRQRGAERAFGKWTGSCWQSDIKMGQWISPPARKTCEVLGGLLGFFDLIAHPVTLSFNGDRFCVVQ